MLQSAPLNSTTGNSTNLLILIISPVHTLLTPDVKGNPKFSTPPNSTESLRVLLVELSGADCFEFTHNFLGGLNEI